MQHLPIESGHILKHPCLLHRPLSPAHATSSVSLSHIDLVQDSGDSGSSNPTRRGGDGQRSKYAGRQRDSSGGPRVSQQHQQQQQAQAQDQYNRCADVLTCNQHHMCCTHHSKSFAQFASRCPLLFKGNLTLYTPPPSALAGVGVCCQIVQRQRHRFPQRGGEPARRVLNTPRMEMMVAMWARLFGTYCIIIIPKIKFVSLLDSWRISVYSYFDAYLYNAGGIGRTSQMAG